MAKKKTEDFEVDMMTTEVNDETKKEVLNASEELYEEIEDAKNTAENDCRNGSANVPKQHD